MSSPTEEQINKRLADFMGHHDVTFPNGKMHYKDICHTTQPRKHYTKSLDESLKVAEVFLEKYRHIEIWMEASFSDDFTIGFMKKGSCCNIAEHTSKIASLALAAAIYKVLEGMES